MDGESTDQTVEIISRYSEFVTYWESCPDSGQVCAINKGFSRARGEIVQWINSDDVLLPNALCSIGEKFDGASLLVGDVIYFRDEREELHCNRGLSAENIVTAGADVSFHQPGIWLVEANVKRLGPLPEKLNYAFDWVYLILYLARWPQVRYLNKPLVKFRLHPKSKTVAHQALFDFERNLGMELVAALGGSASLRAAARRRRDLISWWEYVEGVRTDERVRRVPKALKIAFEALRDPSQRVNRWTLGSIRRALLKEIDG